MNSQEYWITDHMEAERVRVVTMTKKVVSFEVKRVTPSTITAPDDANRSDATGP